MTDRPAGAAVPWQYRHVTAHHDPSATVLRTWTWDTPHFTAEVVSDSSPGIRWSVDSRLPGPTSLGDGQAGDFAAAEAAVKEVVGKSLDPSLGYRRYCGRHATTFTLADGTVLDVGPLLHQRSRVVVHTSHRGVVTYVGTLTTHHWEWEIRTGPDTRVRILPHHVLTVVPEFGTLERLGAWTGMGRVYRGRPTGVCNGTPGFLPDTVDHAGDTCPVHESAAVSA